MDISLLTDKYREMSERKVEKRILRAKKKLGDSLLILGHHYQRDDVIRFADLRGDSFELSKLASEEKKAQYIVFCGVHFMAESAAILCGEERRVMIPDPLSGCPMADMADREEVECAWEDIIKMTGDSIIPVTYMNSDAKIKAFCGEREGAVCTSSNAPGIFRWALGKKEKIFFFPDEHLGRNTAVKLGIGLNDIIVWDPSLDMGGNSAEDVKRARVIVWKGYCHVHTKFQADDIRKIREQFPGIKVIVHPECPYEIVQESDGDGSTGYIVKTVSTAPSKTKWAVGTEIHLVNRLQEENKDKFVTPLSRSLCGTMYLINTRNLLWILEGILKGKYINVVKIPEETSKWARTALERMLAITH